jgi:hypothetical protein
LTASEFLTRILEPDLVWLHALVPSIPDSQEATLCLLAFAGQETGWQNIAQEDGGPGRGPWQFEPATCSDVLENPETAEMAWEVCQALSSVPPTGEEVWGALLARPNLAVAFARLDLWSDPHPLPPLNDEAACLRTYARVWRPAWTTEGGTAAADARARFAGVYAQSIAALKQGAGA